MYTNYHKLIHAIAIKNENTHKSLWMLKYISVTIIMLHHYGIYITDIGGLQINTSKIKRV